MRISQYDWWARQSCSPGWYGGGGAEFPHISSYVRINSEFLLLSQFSTICSECNLNQNSHHFFVIKFFLLQRIHNWDLFASFIQMSFSCYLFLFKSLTQNDQEKLNFSFFSLMPCLSSTLKKEQPSEHIVECVPTPSTRPGVDDRQNELTQELWQQERGAAATCAFAPLLGALGHTSVLCEPHSLLCSG